MIYFWRTYFSNGLKPTLKKKWLCFWGTFYNAEHFDVIKQRRSFKQKVARPGVHAPAFSKQIDRGSGQLHVSTIASIFWGECFIPSGLIFKDKILQICWRSGDGGNTSGRSTCLHATDEGNPFQPAGGMEWAEVAPETQVTQGLCNSLDVWFGYWWWHLPRGVSKGYKVGPGSSCYQL